MSCLHTYKDISNDILTCSIPLLWFGAPFTTVFWVIGASAVLILGHAAMTEPGVESEYAQVEETV
jgi:PRA1 family protein 1